MKTPRSETGITHRFRLAVLAAACLAVPSARAAEIVIPASLALPASSVDTSKRGFVWRVHEVDSATTLDNTKARAVSQLAGQLGNNVADPAASGAADGPSTAPSPATSPIEFRVSGVINFSQVEGDANGNFTPDLQMPGIPGTTGANDNIAAAALTVLEFPTAGTYTMVVNSDDGFETTVGTNPNDLFAIRLGYFEGGRGAADTEFTFRVEAPGLYAFRTLWYEGNGGANIEWSAAASGAPGPTSLGRRANFSTPWVVMRPPARSTTATPPRPLPSSGDCHKAKGRFSTMVTKMESG